MADPFGGLDSYLQQLTDAQKEGLGAAQQSYSGQGSAMDSYLSLLGAQQSGQGQVNVPLMAFAAGLGAPTKTGSFGESLSAGMTSAIPQITAARQSELQRGEAMMKIQMAKANLANELFQKKLGLLNLPLEGVGKFNTGLKDYQNVNFLQDQIRSRQAVQPDRVAADDTTPDVTVPPDPTTTAVPATPEQSAAQTVAAAQAPDSGVNDRISAARAGVEGQSPFGGPAPQQAQAEPAIPSKQAAAQIPTADATMVEKPGVVPGYVDPATQKPVVAAATAKPKAPAKAVSDALAGSKIDPVAVPPMPAGYKPGEQVDLGDGMIGYRPPASLARQLDNAFRMSQMGLQYAGSSDAAAFSKQGQEVLDKLAADKMMWDPERKAIVPMGTNDPRYQQRSENAKEEGKLTAQDAHTMVEIPDPRWSGPAELAPTISVPKQWLMEQQQKAIADAGPQPGGGQPQFPMSKQSPLTLAGANEFAKEIQTLPKAFKDASQAVEDGEHAKEVLRKTPTGALFEIKARAVALGRALGVDIDTSEKGMAGWSPEFYEQLQKYSTKQVFSDVMAIGGRVLVSEIQGLQQANYAPGLQPESNRAIMASTNAQTKYKAAYLRDFEQWRRANPYNIDPSEFAAEWTKKNRYETFYKHEMTTTVAAGAQQPIDSKYYQPPPMDQRHEGMVINFPASKTGVATWAKNPQTGEYGWKEAPRP